MRFLVILFFLISSSAIAQRVEFNDPDLTFSFIKPSEWTLNDGPTIFVLPEKEKADQPITFFSITYFEGPSQTEVTEGVFDAVEVEPSVPSDLKEFNPGKVGRIYIADETALWASYFHTQNKIRIKATSYVFMKFNQRFEISISAPLSDFEETNQKFKAILESLLISQ